MADVCGFEVQLYALTVQSERFLGRSFLIIENSVWKERGLVLANYSGSKETDLAGCL